MIPQFHKSSPELSHCTAHLEGLVLLEEPVPLGDLLVVGFAVDGGLGLQGGNLILDVDLQGFKPQ